MAGWKNAFSPKWLALAAVLGVAAGAAALYVRNAPSGNAGTQTASACPLNAARAKAVGNAATGAVAAVLPADPDDLGALGFLDGDGKPVTLAAFKGQTILLNLWATWCAPCRAEMPALDRLEQEIGGDEFQVVAVNIDTGDSAKADAFLEEVGVHALGRYSDPTMGIFNAFKKRSLALGLPATVIVDPKGCLVAKLNGPAEWDAPEAVRLIEAAMGREAATQ
ncbi:MAG: TlpA family protein disulfide reductase [Notoacmeibacter sp.]|nr:TlpA family protein disulfide reductase [Notoacmeibacter sp.]